MISDYSVFHFRMFGFFAQTEMKLFFPLFAVADNLVMAHSMPQRSTPYFSLKENVEMCQSLQERERTPRDSNSEPRRIVEKSSGRIVDKSSGQVIEGNSVCEHSLPVIRGYISDCLGETEIEMDLCLPYREDDLDKWTNSAKLKIWKTAQSEWTTVEDLQNQLAIGNGAPPPLNAAVFFNQDNLVLTWMDQNSLNRIGELAPKVNLIFNFSRDDRRCRFQWEAWARQKNVLIVNQKWERNHYGAYQSEPCRRAFSTILKNTINSLNNFLKLEHCCPVCKEQRVIHAVFVCDGTSKSVGALLASMMFFGQCDLNTVLSHLLNQRRAWHPVPLVDHTYVLEALFHLQQCIRSAIGK